MKTSCIDDDIEMIDTNDNKTKKEDNNLITSTLKTITKDFLRYGNALTRSASCSWLHHFLYLG